MICQQNICISYTLSVYRFFTLASRALHYIPGTGVTGTISFCAIPVRLLYADMVCGRCHKTIDPEIVLNGLAQDVARQTDFDIPGHRLGFYGLCPNCKECP